LKLNFTDGQSHRVALYALDWDHGSRYQTITVNDAATNAVLDTEKVASFDNGKYLSWQLSGNLKFHVVTNTPATANAVIAGVFFDSTLPIPATPTGVQNIAYDDGVSSGAAKYLRQTSVTYPGPGTRRAVHSNYPSSGVGSVLSRLDNLADDSSGTTKYAQYTYLGAGTIVQVIHPAVRPVFVLPPLTNGLTLSYGTGGTYGGFDRFGRVIENKWTDVLGTTNLDRYQYAYDRMSNRKSRQISPTVSPNNLDEAYTYDGLDRLSKTNRGTLASGTVTDGNSTWQQSWSTLEALGNWRSFVWDLDGGAGGGAAVTQSRTHNAVNELTGFSGTGATWITPVFDAAGNMTQAPKVGAETTRIHLKYDAWNRLVEVDNDSSGSPGSAIATYAYDGLNHRISKTVSGDTYDYYYNESWQVLETRKNADTDPLEQYVWDIRYIDAPVLRWRDSNTDGTVDDTLYYTNDANMNVTGLVNATNGTVVERYTYDPYGKVSMFDASWGARATSSYGNEVLYCGYRYDTETGMYQVRHRTYHPTMGSWSERDPAGYVKSPNLLNYVDQQPLIHLDPMGLITASVTLHTGKYARGQGTSGLFSTGKQAMTYVWEEQWNFTASLSGTPATNAAKTETFPPGSVMATAPAAGKGSVTVGPSFSSQDWYKRRGAPPIFANLLPGKDATGKPEYCVQCAYVAYQVTVNVPESNLAKNVVDLIVSKWTPEGAVYEQLKDGGTSLMNLDAVQNWIWGQNQKPTVGVYLMICADDAKAVGLYNIPKGYDINRTMSDQPNAILNVINYDFYGSWIDTNVGGETHTNNIASMLGPTVFEKWEPSK
jgi:RHS repeat-associated protein